MHPLYRKLLRDLGRMKGQMAAIAIVMACGLGVMIMARSMVRSLQQARGSYFASHHFGDLFCDLKRAPNAVRARLEALPGIATVETRVRGAVRLDLPGMSEPADGLVYSLPEDRPQRLNLLFIRRGRLPEPGRPDEIVVGEAFAKAHGLEPGHTLKMTLYGAQETMRIVGIVLSPDFIFETRPGEAMPDPQRFGIFWMNERKLATALNLKGAFNNIVADLAPGANPKAVLAEIDRLLEPYGGRIAYDRTDHPSTRKLDDDLRVLSQYAIAFPLLFLSVAAFMSSAALTRLIRLQREQIAQLKAFGYSNGAVGWHYLQYALVLVITGGAGGIALGYWLGLWVTEIYRKFFFFPVLGFHFDGWSLLIGLAAAVGTSFVGVISAAREAMRLPPAEAMRPEPPAEFRPSILERAGLGRFTSPVVLMAVRNLERKPWQAFFTMLGLALATAIPIIPGVMRNGIDHVMIFQWGHAQRQDTTLTLIEPDDARPALSAFTHLPGVITAEPFRVVPARLRNGHRERRVSIMGLPQGNRLLRVLDERNRPVAMPLEGLLLSAKLAEVLGLAPGDPVRVEVQEGRRPLLETTVAGTVTDYAGTSAYMELDALRRLLREGETLSGAHLAVDPAKREAFLQEIKAVSRIGAATFTRAAQESFRRTTGEMIGIIQTFYFTFAVVVAFGVVYNGARIALSERSRDLATLRVIGFSPREVATVLILELGFLTVLALAPGLWIGSRLAAALVATTSTETVRMPYIFDLPTALTSVLVILVSSFFSFAVVSRRIHDLDLLSVLKARD